MADIPDNPADWGGPITKKKKKKELFDSNLLPDPPKPAKFGLIFKGRPLIDFDDTVSNISFEWQI